MTDEVVRSVYYSQQDILRGIAALHAPAGFECDVTFGKGGFWADLPAPPLRFDIDPQSPDVTQACSTALPLADKSLGSLVFDPPFLTYVRAGREGNGKMIMARQFAGYWTFGELTAHYQQTLLEAARVLKPRGVMVFKCQDVIQWATERGFRLLDLFVLPAKNRLPSPNRKGAQRHARIFHSYFLVFERLK